MAGTSKSSKTSTGVMVIDDAEQQGTCCLLNLCCLILVGGFNVGTPGNYFVCYLSNKFKMYV